MDMWARISSVIFLFFFLFGCSAKTQTTVQFAQIVQATRQFEGQVDMLAKAIKRNESVFAPEDLALLKQAYNDWLNVVDILKQSDCSVPLDAVLGGKTSFKTCKITVGQISWLHEEAKNAYEKFHKVIVRYKLSPPVQYQVKQLEKIYVDLDEAVSQFEKDPNADNAIAVIRGANAATKTVSLIIPMIEKML